MNIQILNNTDQYCPILLKNAQYCPILPNIVKYCKILSNITKYFPIVINIAQYCSVLFNIVQVTISAHSYQKYDIARNIQILCKIVILPHSVLHLGFSAGLKIFQVPTCKMEPQRGCIMQRTPSTQPPTQQPNLTYGNFSPRSWIFSPILKTNFEPDIEHKY